MPVTLFTRNMVPAYPFGKTTGEGRAVATRRSRPGRTQEDGWMSQHETPMRGKVLLVEDDPMIRALTVEWIEDAGFECQEAGSGEEALGSFDAADGYRAAILDVTLPDITGAELADSLRRVHPGIPVLFATGNRNLLSEDVLAQAATDVLSKPYSNRELRNALRVLLEG